MNDNFNLPNHIHGEKRLYGLDLMRACSIMMVFLSHSVPFNPLVDYFPYFSFLGFGVEAFFVLSGFLIGRIILKTLFKPEITWRNIRMFWVNRWLRTLPAYFFAVLVYYFTTYSRNIFVYIFFGQNVITPMAEFFPHSWSLAVEEWFYLLFPMALFVIAYVTGNRKNKYEVFMIGTILFMLFGLVARIVCYLFYKNGVFDYLLENEMIFRSWRVFLSPQGRWDSMRKIVPFRIDAIAYGCIVAFAYRKAPFMSKSKSIFLLVTGLAVLFLSFYIVSQTIVGLDSGFFADVFLLPLFCLSFALMLPYALICPTPGKLMVTIVTSVSQTSYSFYLIHFLVLHLVLVQFPHITTAGAIEKWPIFAGTYFVTYFVSYLMFKLIETPFLNYRKKLSLSEI